jgi:type I restriction enzyme M protein
VRDLYEEGKKVDKEVFKEDIRLSDQRIATVVGFLQDIDLGKTDLDRVRLFSWAFFHPKFYKK